MNTDRKIKTVYWPRAEKMGPLHADSQFSMKLHTENAGQQYILVFEKRATGQVEIQRWNTKYILGWEWE